MQNLIPPYGGQLIDLMLNEQEAAEQLQRASALPSIQISDRSVCDLELLASGGFSPLRTFLNRQDYERVLAEMRLVDGTLWPIPITLPIDAPEDLRLDHGLALRNSKNELMAVMEVTDIFEWELEREAAATLGTADPAHPLIAEMESWGRVCVSGPLKVVALPRKWDFRAYRLTPRDVRERLEKCSTASPGTGHARVVAFQTRNPLHRAHEEMTKRAAQKEGSILLLHPVVGMTKPGDIDHFTRCRIYKLLYENYYDKSRTVLAFLPLAMRMAGPREALLHGVIRRNHGANHFIVGRDHAGPGIDSSGKPFYGPNDAQDLFRKHSEEIGVEVVPFKSLLYLPDEDRYEEADKIPPGVNSVSISGTHVREEYLAKGKPLPEWFTRKETAEILRQAYPPRHCRGFCVWFTGLSGSGKSTTAEILVDLLMEHARSVTLLDGDVVRTHLSKGLGFSKADRDTNITRIGFVASEIASHGGAVVCAAVSPYRATRNRVRNMFPEHGFIEVFVDTPLEVCEQRDVKGLYSKARRGEITGFTGIDDPYEAPPNAEIVLDTVHESPWNNARRIISLLHERGFIV